jgi:uncharacterized protein YndB with AHSA1/START domain
MNAYIDPKIDPVLDLVLDRFVDVPPALVWKVWTTPELLMPWFCPKPWQTVACKIDLRPGGEFSSVMRSPEGQEFPNRGCYVDVVQGQRFAWTDGFLPGFRPAPPNPHGFRFTAVLTITPEGKGTRYIARAMHQDEAGAKAHAKMGFYEGWGTVLDQLVAYIKSGMKGA